MTTNLARRLRDVADHSREYGSGDRPLLREAAEAIDALTALDKTSAEVHNRNLLERKTLLDRLAAAEKLVAELRAYRLAVESASEAYSSNRYEETRMIAPTPTFATCQRCQARLYVTEGRVFCPNCDSSATRSENLNFSDRKEGE